MKAQQCWFVCDHGSECGEESPTARTFGEARKLAEKGGWVIRPDDANKPIHILRAANKGSYRVQTGHPFTARHIQQAVFRCRQLELVNPRVLVAAGFREKRR